MTKIGIIGAGNMGAAFYKGLATHFEAKNLCIADTDSEKLKAFEASFTSTDFNEVLGKSDFILLAVKPQSFEELCRNLSVDLSQKIVISIMAGTSIETLKKGLKTEKIIRSMPNLPVQVGHGLTGWMTTSEVSSEEKDFVQKIFRAVGKEIEVPREEMLNEITALSGSGPAYFFYLCELMMQQAINWGFDPESAQTLVQETFLGSALLLQEKNENPAHLRMAVTSKGGTTEAALKTMMSQNLEGIFTAALEAARQRSIELNSPQ